MTDREHWDFWASISKDSPRCENWAAVFDDPQRVPIVSPIAERVQLPIGVRRVLFVKGDLLSDDERRRMVRYLAERFQVAPEDVDADLEANPNGAVPILDEDVSVMVKNPQRWF